MSLLGRMWARLRGKEGDPTFGTQIAVVGAAAAVADTQTDDKDSGDATPDYGWSGDHVSGSDFGGGGGFDGGGGDGGGSGF